MTQALGPASYVHEGFWINWSQGRMQGLTLTLCPKNANLLIAALTLFVAMSGGQLWTIIRFTLHQTRASPKSQALVKLHDQQQLILRNIPTDLASARLFLCLAWTWRKKAVKPCLTSAAIVLLCVAHAIFFMFAGTFSSNVTTADQTVLSRSPYCGVFKDSYYETTNGNINTSSTDAFRLSLEYIAWEEHDIQLSLEYARECYMTTPTTSSSSSCGTFQQSHFNWATKYNGTCPFGSEVCPDNLDAIVFDTGLIDSHNGLGINADLEDRVSYRRVTQCTVLNDTNYMTGWINQTDDREVQNAFVNYGVSIQQGTNYTYAYSNFADFYTEFSSFTTTPYQVDAQIAYGESIYSDSSTFSPVPELQQRFADVMLFFLSYTGRYIEPIDDPWFSAKKLHHSNSRAAIARETFVRDRPISTLGCTEQHQICTSGGSCTALLGFLQVQEALQTNYTLFTANQNATVDRILRAVAFSTMKSVVDALAISSTPLLAISEAASEITTLSLPLPPTQWQSEAYFWHSVAMAHLQRTFVEYGTGQIAAQTDYIQTPDTPGERYICANLMIRGTEFQSFNVFALLMLASFGTIIVLLSLTIESLASCIQMRFSDGVSRRKLWDEQDLLGLRVGSRTSQLHIPFQDSPYMPMLKRDVVEARSPVEMVTLSPKEEPRIPRSQFHESWLQPPEKKAQPPAQNFDFGFPSNRTSFADVSDTGGGLTAPAAAVAVPACATCGVTRSGAWHLARMGDGLWCDKCLRWYQTYMEGSRMEGQDDWI